MLSMHFFLSAEVALVEAMAKPKCTFSQAVTLTDRCPVSAPS